MGLMITVDGVTFQPYIGDDYEQGINGTRLLILGESHYCKERCRPVDAEAKSQFTRKIIRDLATSRSYRYFTTILRLVLEESRSKKIHSTPRRDFWNKVAFYNYIQDFVGVKSLDRPLKDQWQDAQQPLLNVLERLQPQLVLVTGQELKDHLPKPFPEQYKTCFIKHPSWMKFSFADSAPLVRSSLASFKT